MLDCGATINVLPYIDAATVNPKLTALRPAEARLTMFDGTELKTLGMLNATVEHSLTRKQKRMDFYVAAMHDRAILGMKACRDMDLLFVNESNICSIQNGRSTVSNVNVVGHDDVIAHRSSEAVAAAAGQPLTKEVIVERYIDLFTSVGRLQGDLHL